MLRPLAIGLAALVVLPATAFAHAPGAPQLIESATEIVRGGAGNQTNPHISGSLVAFQEAEGFESRVRYRDLATGVEAAIANDGQRDSLPDVSGSMIVFRRVFVDGSIGRPILAFDTANPALGVREVAPSAGARRTFPSIGGDTVAFMQYSSGSSTVADVCVATLAAIEAPAVCLTTDGDTMSNQDPAVSADGATVAWAKCDRYGQVCDIYVARRASTGTWDSGRQLTDSTGEEYNPDTDGKIVTYASNAGGDYDIWWEEIDGTDEHQLVLADAPGSTEHNPKISGGLISFERELPGSTDGDLYLVDPAGDRLFRLTDTPTDEFLNGLAVAADGTIRFVWAQFDTITLGHADVYAGTFSLAQGPLYSVCPLFDPARSFRLGGTAPIKLQLCDGTGANVSSAATTLTVTGLVKRDASAAPGLIEDAGNANPDHAFRYDAALAGYIYNLSTKGLTRGTWELRFTASDDPGTEHRVPFDLR